MAIKFNPLTGNFDFTGSGGGGASYIDGEVAVYADLSLSSSTAPLNSAWLVRTASGVWPVTRKQAGIYIRTATGGSNRDSDYTYAGTMPDVFSDAQFTLYGDSDSSRNVKFDVDAQVGSGQTRIITVPNTNVTLPNQGTSTGDSPAFNKLTLTPDSSDSSLKLGTLEFQSYTTNNAWIGDNVYLDGSTFRRRSAGAATLFYFQGDEGQFRCDVSSSAGTSVTNAPTFKVGTGGQFSAGANVSNAGYFDSAMLFCDGSNIGLSDASDEAKKAKLDLSGITPDETRVLSLPDASGVIALTQQATDYEITDSTKGLVLKSPNNTRWRITINNDGTLSRAALAVMTLLAFAASGMAQVRDMVTDTNGNIVTGRTNVLTFSNRVTIPIASGAATTNSLLTADGVGGSSFVASRNTYLRATNVAFSNSITPTNITGMSWTVSANKTYMVSVSAIIDQQAGGYDVRIQWPSALAYTNATNTSGSGVAAIGSGAFTPAWTTNTNNLRLFTRGGASLPQQAIAFVMVATGTNGGTASFQVCQSSTNATATTLTLLTASIEEL
jgi:hypothetical protein